MRRYSVAWLPTILITALSAASSAAAQDSLPPWQGGITTSLGQPPRRNWFAGASAGTMWDAGGVFQPVGYATFGNHFDIGSPVTAFLGGSVEGFIGFRGGDLDGGGRALLSILTNRFQGGVEYNATEGELHAMLGFTTPLRRGGLFGGGSWARLEWSVGNSLRMSVLAPLANPLAGRTRPHKEQVLVAPRVSTNAPYPISVPELDEALANVRAAAIRIQQLIVPFIDPPGANARLAMAPSVAQIRTPAALPIPAGDSGLNVDAIVRFYHAELARAFSIAASGRPFGVGRFSPEGDSLAQLARHSLLQREVYPYNRLLGQWKSDGTLDNFAAYARGDFARQLATTNITQKGKAPAFYVFQSLLETIDSVRAREASAWGDNRLIWLPLQLGLRPEEHDDQGELDTVVQDAVGKEFQNGNRVWYVINEQFQTEAVRTIREARSYHVLWIHDFSGRNDLGEPDPTSLLFVVDAYMRALTDAARRYDSTRTMPVYMIFLDEHYYELNGARVWLDILEHPLDAEVELPAGHEDQEDRIRAARDSLRVAVAGSPLLQVELQQYGRAWLGNVVKVQVNVTFPADASFWGPGILPVIGFPDNIMRDHRKILFYDLSEDDPYSGEALFTGVGIGEHYVGQTWEDRSLVLQGPSALPLKEDARRLLASQGLTAEQIPYPLRPRPLAQHYQQLIDAEISEEQGTGFGNQRAMELHNLTGYQSKPIDVVRATLYSMMPPGSVVKIPDSLWGNALYAALLCGSAFRGVRVLLVAPSLASAPSSGWPQMGITHDLFARLIVIQQELGPELEASGGMLKTGIYNPGIGVLQAGERFDAAYRNGRRTPFLRRLFPIAEGVDSALAHSKDLAATMGIAPGAPSAITQQVTPKLHMKASFFATREGWDSLISRPEMARVFAVYMQQIVPDPSGTTLSVRQRSKGISDASQALVNAFTNSLTPEARAHVAYFLVIGSANQDYRSMLMDGEAAVVLSGWSTVVSLIDFSLIVSLSVWVDDLQLLDDLLPPPTGVQRAVARMVRPAL